MSNALAIPTNTGIIKTTAAVGAAANHFAALNSFQDYRGRKSDNTLRAQGADLATFSDYLAVVGLALPGERLATDPSAWAGMTWGLVAGFVAWMLGNGYALGSIARKLATVRVYARLAAQSGAISPADLTMIQTVKPVGGKEGARVDERRTQTRQSPKKSEHVELTTKQAAALKRQPDTPQGRRDALLIALLADLGLRVGEVALLEVGDFDLKENVVRFFRPKVGKTQTHRLTPDLRRALSAWVDAGDCPPFGPVLRGSRKGGALTAAGMTERAITERVKVLGEAIGVHGLSAHDLRHYWATQAAKKSDIVALRDAGGWSSLAMPNRYIAAGKIANEGIVLPADGD